MKSKILVITLLLISFVCVSQNKYTINGYITNKNSGESLIGATVYEANSLKGVVSNSYGYFSLALPQGECLIICSYIGYITDTIKVVLSEKQNIDIQLSIHNISINEVVVSAKDYENILQSNEYKIEKLTIKNIRQLPILFGEADLVKAIQMQSGVKTLGDGSSGMFIRGGSSDQNLILIDEAPIYNPSHMFGLLSVFTPDAINNVTLYKSNMPAQYGGRVAAVVDCKMKEGNLYKYGFSAGVNILSASLYANGPIVKGKSSFLISVRKSMFDLIFKPQYEGYRIVPGFYDINFKMNTKVGKKDRLFVSFYNGQDRVKAFDGFDNDWSNITSTIRWNRNLSTKLFSNMSFIYSNYTNNLQYIEGAQGYKWQTGVEDFNGKLDLSYFSSPNSTFKFGINCVYHKFIPGETVDTLQSIPRIQAYESAIYLLNDLKLFTWLGINYGLRFSIFQNTDNAKWFDYNEDYIPIKENTNSDGIYHTNYNFEPRISINLTISPKYSLKFAYARNAQYMQVLQNTSLSYTSLETWFPANTNIDPIIVDVISGGWFQKLNTKYFVSAELYYKDYKNQIDYIGHAKLTDNQYIEAEVRKGTARAYGCELEIKKQNGKLTGSISYSYSRAFRKIKDINNNIEYSSPFDIPHDFRILANYKITKKWFVSSLWLFTSGRPVTLPIGYYKDESESIPIYSDRNEARFPNYHRLDVSVNYTTKPEKKKIYWDFGFGVYNLYAHENPIGYENTGTTISSQTFLDFMPNISIKATF